jgi:pyridoxal phosphate enzyme (YggS family)
MDTIAARYRNLMDRIASAARGAGREPAEIALVAVSKTVEPAGVREAYAAGVRRFGENRAQELLRKREALADLAIEWHFVGHLQSNKARGVAETARLIHSVDRPELAEKLSLLAPPQTPQQVLVQVNTSGEATKSGVEPAGLSALLDGIARLPGLRVEGLMTIGPLTDDPERVRAAFRLLRALRDRERAADRPGMPLHALSMGMSGDYETAIEEGATLVRIGSALFGPRG